MAESKGKSHIKDKKKGAPLRLIFFMIIALLLVAFLRTGFIFFVIAMLPSFIAYFVDRHRPRTTFHTIFACNLSGVIPFIIQIIREGPYARGFTTELMSDMLTWLIIYGSAGLGILLVTTTPLFAQLLISMFNKGQIARFEMLQNRIVKEWGHEVSQTTNHQTDEQA